MPLNERGRTFESGKALSNDLRRSLIDEVVLAGGNTGSCDQIPRSQKHRQKSVEKFL